MPSEDTAVLESSAPTLTSAPSVADRISAVKKAGGPAAQHWQMTGDIDEAEKLGSPTNHDVIAAPSPADDDHEPETPAENAGAVTTEPASGTGKKTEQSKSARTSWSELREAKAKAEARAELLEQQLAESRKSLPAKEVLPSQPQIDPNKPKRPRLSDFETVEKYEAAMDTYEEARDRYHGQTLDQRDKTRTEQQAFRTATDKWEAIKTQGKAEFKDFDEVAFNKSVSASLAGIIELQQREDGHKIMYHLGKNPEIAASLAQATDIPGYANWAAVIAAARKDPDLAMLVGEKRGIAKARIAQIAESLSKKTTPVTSNIARQPKPSGELAVESNSGPIVDELTDAINRNDLPAYKRIMNKRDAARMGT